MSSLASTAHLIDRVPVAAARRTSLSATLPALLEFLFVAAAILALLPSFDRVARFGDGRDGRFLDHGLVVAGLPEPLLAGVCRSHGELAHETLRRALCSAEWLSMRASTPAGRTLDPPPALARALAQAALAFAEPLRAARARIAALPRDAEPLPGGGDPLDAAAAIEDEIDPFVRRYRLDGDEPAIPEPLRCLLRWTQATPARAPTDAADVATRADAFLLLAAAVDGRAATGPLAADAALPRAGPAASRSVPRHRRLARGDRRPDGRRPTGRRRRAQERRDARRRALGRRCSGDWRWRSATSSSSGAGGRDNAASASAPRSLTWAAAGWLAARALAARPATRAFVPARADASLAHAPAAFVVALAVAGALVLVGAALAAWRRRGLAPPALATQSMSSRVGYAGFVLATGLGALVLLDLSFHGHFGNRYLALYHQGHLWLGMLVVLSVRRCSCVATSPGPSPGCSRCSAKRRGARSLRVGRRRRSPSPRAATLAALLGVRPRPRAHGASSRPSSAASG